MRVVPAIDIRAGRVVRLKQGRLQDETVYGSDPVEAARRWEAQGAARLHVVDLDAAIEGRPQPDVVGAIIAAVRIPVEVGGGLRALENAMRYRQQGADRVIFGTAAIAAPGVVQEAVRLWPEAVAVAVDARNGLVSVAGWQEITQVEATELARQVKAWGVPRIQYTDTQRDGVLVGPNTLASETLARACGLRVTIAGGVGSLEDLERIRPLEALGVDEVVVGRALYEERFSLAEAQAAVADA
jgi:phosphoribosylformimino-5-aminoimidazole carboxamide ribotide isomerase